MTNQEFACRLDALNPREREERSRLAQALRFATTNVVEIENGYALTLDARGPLADSIQRFTELEARCCSFLEFDVTQSDAVVELRITGPVGVKHFLLANFELPKSKD